MFVPGNNPRLMADAHHYGPDSLIFDLEDSVKLSEKDSARLLVYNALKTIDYGNVEKVVRVNPLNTPYGKEDIRAMVFAGAEVIRLPKSETASDIIEVDEWITKCEKEAGREIGSVGMMAAIESGLGILNAQEIAKASPRLVAMSIGAEDFVRDLKTTRTAIGTELFTARSMLVFAARAAGIAAIDTVFSDVNDMEGFIKEVEQIKQLGFDGKSVINPRQIEPIVRIYTPTAEEIEKAEKVLEAIREAEERGLGVISLNGKMVDKPVVERAMHIIKYAEASGVHKTVKTVQPDSIVKTGKSKIVKDLKQAIQLANLTDGMTISFHHHFRNGDYIVNTVLNEIAGMGIKNLTVAASSLSDVHSPMIEHIRNGVVERIETSGLRGELANQISHGLMEKPVVFRSHGGRANAIASGQLKIDVAFLGVPSTDQYGNANGFSRDGDNSSACGSLGYAMVDARYAGKVILLSNNIVAYPNTPCAIPQSDVDYIVEVDEIGDPKGIVSGATRYSTNPKELKIAGAAADVMEASGYFEDGFSFQTGTGGSSLAVTRFLREKMLQKGIKASFALGGITGQIVKLHEEGFVKKLLDVQSFDLDAVSSTQRNEFHHVVDAYFYAGSGERGAAVDQLDMVVLSAFEIDVHFNVNVLTGSDGIIRGAVGGHPDTSDGAKVAIIVAPLVRGRIPTVLDRVNTICTPGITVDVLVTDQGIAVNPARPDLIERLEAVGIQVETIEALKEKAEKIAGRPSPIKYGEKVVGVVASRDGDTIDKIYEIIR